MTTDDQCTTLAQLALQVLDAQQVYFKSRTFNDLGRSKQLEQQLRDLAERVLADAVQPSLFGDDQL